MTNRLTISLIALFIALQAVALYLMGHPLICTCGYVTLWHGDVFSPQTSQQITDWYTFGHVNHGILFYGLAWWLMRRASFNWRALAVAFTGLVWEVGENTPFVIERFRAVTMSLEYYGDSAINSVFDSVFMMGGVLLARRVPVWVSVAVVLGTEVLTTAIVRDGLALNTLMLLYPIEAIKEWQLSGWTH
jgi:hypothetical protein